MAETYPTTQTSILEEARTGITDPKLLSLMNQYEAFLVSSGSEEDALLDMSNDELIDVDVLKNSGRNRNGDLA